MPLPEIYGSLMRVLRHREQKCRENFKKSNHPREGGRGGGTGGEEKGGGKGGGRGEGST